VRVCPSVGVPEIAGAPVDVGGTDCTGGVGADVAVVLPPELLAVTMTRMVELISELVAV
jgi:hypothetical protein